MISWVVSREPLCCQYCVDLCHCAPSLGHWRPLKDTLSPNFGSQCLAFLLTQTLLQYLMDFPIPCLLPSLSHQCPVHSVASTINKQNLELFSWSVLSFIHQWFLNDFINYFYHLHLGLENLFDFTILAFKNLSVWHRL